MANKLVFMLLSIEPELPHLCGTPFFQATAAAAMGFEVEMYFASRSMRLLVQGVADRIYPSDNRAKSVYGFMQDASEQGVKFFACKGAMDAFSVTPEQLIPEVTGLAGATSFIWRVMDNEWKALTY